MAFTILHDLVVPFDLISYYCPAHFALASLASLLSFSMSDIVLLQDLGPHSIICLEAFPVDICMTCSHGYFRFLLKCYHLSEQFSDHPMNNYNS